MDGDATTNAVSYSLVDGFGDPVVGGAFAIDAASGVVSVADTSQLDYESQASHDIIVRATSAGRVVCRRDVHDCAERCQ